MIEKGVPAGDLESRDPAVGAAASEITPTQSRGRRQVTKTDRVVRDLFWLLALITGLWLLHRYGRVLPDVALAAVGLSLATLLVFGLFWRRRVSRRAFLRVYVSPGSPLARWLRGGLMLAATQIPAAVLLTLMLTIAVIRLHDPWVWMVMLAAGLALVVTQALLRHLLQSHASTEYLPALSWRMSVVLVALLTVAVLTSMALNQAYPAFAGVSVERAVWHLADQEQARGAMTQMLLQLAAAKDALMLWLAQQLMPVPGVSQLQFFGWVLVLVDEGLFVWSYLLLCQSLLIAVNSDDRAAS